MIQKNYNTKQRNVLLNFFKSNPDKCYTAKELIKNPMINLGEATIYRCLLKFVNDKTLKKYISDTGESALYQYNNLQKNCHSHFHLKCTNCGTLFHMDCHLMDDMKKHIEQKHLFTIDNSQTTLYGTCKNCSSKE